MSSFVVRRGGPRRPRPGAPSLVGHFYLNTADRRLFCLNEPARQLLRQGLPINSADLERSPLLLFDGTPVRSDDLPLRAAWREGMAREASFLWPRSEEPVQVLTWCAAPLVGADGRLVGISATAVLTPHEPDWEDLAGLAHDLRTPLQALRLLVPLVQTQPPPDVLTDLLARLRAAAERAIAISQDLLDWCKAPTQPGLVARRDWLPLTPLLQSLTAEQEITARSKGIGLETDLAAAQGVEMLTNRNRLGRVVGNLLGNAVRYTSAGRVRLAATWREGQADSGSFLVLSVEDTGAGLAQEEQESIFEPYQRGKAGLADSDSGGSGVGLPTVDHLIGELGLTLEVVSEPGKGSRFDLLVPGNLLRRPE
jgi:signal transduction histidine kinase